MQLDINRNAFLKSNYFRSSMINQLVEGAKKQLRLEFTLEENIDFPDDNYLIYSVYMKNLAFIDTISQETTILNFSHSVFRNNNHFLIAVNKKSNELLFISGYFFKSTLISFYEQINDVETLKEYLKLKYFDIKITDFNQVIERKKYWKLQIIDSKGKIHLIKVSKTNSISSDAKLSER